MNATDWKALGASIAKTAPLVGAALGGPAGGAIGAVLASIFGGDSSSAGSVAAAIERDPEAALKLAQLESDERVKLQSLVFAHADALIAFDTASLQADVADRSSARDREKSVGGRTPAALAWVVLVASVGVGAAVMTGYMTKDPVHAGNVGIVIGYVFSESKQVLAYYFGSSQGSDRKTELMAKATPATEPNIVSAP